MPPRRAVLLVLALAGLACSSCGVLFHHQGVVRDEVLGESVVRYVEREVVVDGPDLSVQDVRLEGRALSLAVAVGRTCAVSTSTTYAVRERMKTAWLDGDGEPSSPGELGIAELFGGLATAVVIGVCASSAVCKSADSPAVAPPAVAPETGWVVGGIIGGTISLLGLIDIGASMWGGETSERTVERVDATLGPRRACGLAPLADHDAVLRLGARRVPVRTDARGVARLDLGTLGAESHSAGTPVVLTLEAVLHGASLAARVDLDALDPAALSAALGGPPVSRTAGSATWAGSLRDQVVAAMPLEFLGADTPAQGQAAALLEVYAAHLSQAGLRLIPGAEVHEALERERAASYRPCVDDACQLELGRQLAAGVVLRTTVVRIDDRCTVSAIPFDLRTNTALVGVTRPVACDAIELQDGLVALADALGR